MSFTRDTKPLNDDERELVGYFPQWGVTDMIPMPNFETGAGTLRGPSGYLAMLSPSAPFTRDMFVGVPWGFGLSLYSVRSLRDWDQYIPESDKKEAMRRMNLLITDSSACPPTEDTATRFSTDGGWLPSLGPYGRISFLMEYNPTQCKHYLLIRAGLDEATLNEIEEKMLDWESSGKTIGDVVEQFAKFQKLGAINRDRLAAQACQCMDLVPEKDDAYVNMATYAMTTETKDSAVLSWFDGTDMIPTPQESLRWCCPAWFVVPPKAPVGAAAGFPADAVGRSGFTDNCTIPSISPSIDTPLYVIANGTTNTNESVVMFYNHCTLDSSKFVENGGSDGLVYVHNRSWGDAKSIGGATPITWVPSTQHIVSKRSFHFTTETENVPVPIMTDVTGEKYPTFLQNRGNETCTLKLRELFTRHSLCKMAVRTIAGVRVEWWESQI